VAIHCEIDCLVVLDSHFWVLFGIDLRGGMEYVHQKHSAETECLLKPGYFRIKLRSSSC
jgi:hypothetical protein